MKMILGGLYGKSGNLVYKYLRCTYFKGSGRVCYFTVPDFVAERRYSGIVFIGYYDVERNPDQRGRKYYSDSVHFIFYQKDICSDEKNKAVPSAG